MAAEERSRKWRRDAGGRPSAKRAAESGSRSGGSDEGIRRCDLAQTLSPASLASGSGADRQDRDVLGVMAEQIEETDLMLVEVRPSGLGPVDHLSG